MANQKLSITHREKPRHHFRSLSDLNARVMFVRTSSPWALEMSRALTVTSIGFPVKGSSESFLVVLVTLVELDSVPPIAVDSGGQGGVTFSLVSAGRFFRLSSGIRSDRLDDGRIIDRRDGIQHP